MKALEYCLRNVEIGFLNAANSLLKLALSHAGGNFFFRREINRFSKEAERMSRYACSLNRQRGGEAGRPHGYLDDLLFDYNSGRKHGLYNFASSNLQRQYDRIWHSLGHALKVYYAPVRREDGDSFSVEDVLDSFRGMEDEQL